MYLLEVIMDLIETALNIKDLVKEIAVKALLVRQDWNLKTSHIQNI